MISKFRKKNWIELFWNKYNRSNVRKEFKKNSKKLDRSPKIFVFFFSISSSFCTFLAFIEKCCRECVCKAHTMYASKKSIFFTRQLTKVIVVCVLVECLNCKLRKWNWSMTFSNTRFLCGILRSVNAWHYCHCKFYLISFFFSMLLVCVCVSFASSSNVRHQRLYVITAKPTRLNVAKWPNILVRSLCFITEPIACVQEMYSNGFLYSSFVASAALFNNCSSKRIANVIPDSTSGFIQVNLRCITIAHTYTPRLNTEPCEFVPILLDLFFCYFSSTYAFRRRFYYHLCTVCNVQTLPHWHIALDYFISIFI